MNYKETVEYLFEKLPMYQRIGPAAFKKDLSNTIKLLSALGNPETGFRSVHVAGTNGKGSVCHILTSVLIEEGFKTGLYTSPHLTDFRERIRINGKPVGEDAIIEFVDKNKSLIEKIKPSFFEITVAMAFYFFTKEKVDIAIVETGLGGRLDSTNVLKPLISVITNISPDHQHMLGDTIELIAAEKAGIIKDNTPVVLGERNTVTDKVFQEIAYSHDSPVYFACDDYSASQSDKESCINVCRKDIVRFKDLRSDLGAVYQRNNILTSLAVSDLLNNKGIRISDNSFISGVRKTRENTGLRGRWETLELKPKVICDIAHNSEAIKYIVKRLENESFDKLRIVYGMSNDKSFDLILGELPAEAEYYFCRPDVPRGLDVHKLAEMTSEFGLKGRTFGSVKDALCKAKENCNTNDLILITGSAFVVAEALESYV